MRLNAQTKQYIRKHTAEGKTRREITTYLKRYIAREIYQLLTKPHTTPDPERLHHQHQQTGITTSTQPKRPTPTQPATGYLQTLYTHNHHHTTQLRTPAKTNPKTGCKT